jgi:drug/metabolite transporter (DMT)-like permease
LLGCLLAGVINGLGSLFYYSALGRIEASVGQLLYSLYPLFLVIWLAMDKQAPSRLTLMRLSLALPAIFLLTQTGRGETDWVGIIQMLIAAALYALHLPINQHVLYDMPAPTVTVYTLLAMSAVVVPAYLFSGFEVQVLQIGSIWPPMLGLTLVTFLSRLTLFLGVKRLGGMQTALLGLSEVLVTVFFAHLWLGERLSSLQWLGALLLVASLLLVLKENPPPRKHSSGGLNTKSRKPGWLDWLQPL